MGGYFGGDLSELHAGPCANGISPMNPLGTALFIANGEPTEGREPWTFDQRFEEAIQDPRRRRNFDVMSEKEKEEFCDMIKSILKFRPGERMTAEGVLRSQWMTEWAIPDAEKSWGLR